MSKFAIACAGLLLTVSLGVVACRSGEGSPPPLITPTTPATGVPTDAAALYASNCAGCHGADRQGGVGPPLNAGTLGPVSESQIIQTIANGRPGTAMPAWKDSLTAEQIQALAEYVKS